MFTIETLTPPVIGSVLLVLGHAEMPMSSLIKIFVFSLIQSTFTSA